MSAVAISLSAGEISDSDNGNNSKTAERPARDWLTDCNNEKCELPVI